MSFKFNSLIEEILYTLNEELVSALESPEVTSAKKKASELEAAAADAKVKQKELEAADAKKKAEIVKQKLSSTPI